MFICKNLTPCVSCILFVFVFVYIILISTVVVFWNVAFLVIQACDSACVFAKKFPRHNSSRRLVIFDAAATSDVRDFWMEVYVLSFYRVVS